MADFNLVRRKFRTRDAETFRVVANQLANGLIRQVSFPYKENFPQMRNGSSPPVFIEWAWGPRWELVEKKGEERFLTLFRIAGVVYFERNSLTID